MFSLYVHRYKQPISHLFFPCCLINSTFIVLLCYAGLSIGPQFHSHFLSVPSMNKYTPYIPSLLCTQLHTCCFRPYHPSTHAFYSSLFDSSYLEILFLYRCRWARRSAAASEGGWPPKPQTDVRQTHQPAAWFHSTHFRLADTCIPKACGGQRWMREKKKKKQVRKKETPPRTSVHVIFIITIVIKPTHFVWLSL